MKVKLVKINSTDNDLFNKIKHNNLYKLGIWPA